MDQNSPPTAWSYHGPQEGSHDDLRFRNIRVQNLTIWCYNEEYRPWHWMSTIELAEIFRLSNDRRRFGGFSLNMQVPNRGNPVAADLANAQGQQVGSLDIGLRLDVQILSKKAKCTYVCGFLQPLPTVGMILETIRSRNMHVYKYHPEGSGCMFWQLTLLQLFAELQWISFDWFYTTAHAIKAFAAKQGPRFVPWPPVEGDFYDPPVYASSSGKKGKASYHQGQHPAGSAGAHWQLERKQAVRPFQFPEAMQSTQQPNVTGSHATSHRGHPSTSIIQPHSTTASQGAPHRQASSTSDYQTHQGATQAALYQQPSATAQSYWSASQGASYQQPSTVVQPPWTAAQGPPYHQQNAASGQQPAIVGNHPWSGNVAQGTPYRQPMVPEQPPWSGAQSGTYQQPTASATSGEQYATWHTAPSQAHAYQHQPAVGQQAAVQSASYPYQQQPASTGQPSWNAVPGQAGGAYNWQQSAPVGQSAATTHQPNPNPSGSASQNTQAHSTYYHYPGGSYQG